MKTKLRFWLVLGRFSILSWMEKVTSRAVNPLARFKLITIRYLNCIIRNNCVINSIFLFSQEKEPLVCPPPTQGPPPTVKRLGLFSLLGISIVLTMVCLKNEKIYSDIYLTKEQAGNPCFETEHFLIEIENNLYMNVHNSLKRP